MEHGTTRRRFVAGATAAAASWLATRSLANGRVSSEEPAHDTLVVVFLRGGCDALNVVLPVEGASREDYERAFPVLAAIRGAA